MDLHHFALVIAAGAVPISTAAAAAADERVDHAACQSGRFVGT